MALSAFKKYNRDILYCTKSNLCNNNRTETECLYLFAFMKKEIDLLKNIIEVSLDCESVSNYCR